MDTPTLVGTGFFILAAVVWVVCAIYCYQMAPKFGRNPITWVILGIIFGPIALMILFILPKGHRAASPTSSSSPGHAAAGSTHKQTQADLYEVPNKKKHH
jgi:putative exporter of polyketide antibiotics